MWLLWTTVLAVAVHQVASASVILNSKNCDGCNNVFGGTGGNFKIDVDFSIVLRGVKKRDECAKNISSADNTTKETEEMTTPKTTLGITTIPPTTTSTTAATTTTTTSTTTTTTTTTTTPTTTTTSTTTTTTTTTTTPTTTTSTTTTTTTKSERWCPSSFTLAEGGCFKAVPGVATGDQAMDVCHKYARDTAVPEDYVSVGVTRNSAQNRAIFDMAMSDQKIMNLRYVDDEGMWLGIQRTDYSTSDPRFYAWKDIQSGELISYTNFHAGQPDNNLREYCVHMYLRSDRSRPYNEGTWNDMTCGGTRISVLCEYTGS